MNILVRNGKRKETSNDREQGMWIGYQEQFNESPVRYVHKEGEQLYYLVYFPRLNTVVYGDNKPENIVLSESDILIYGCDFDKDFNLRDYLNVVDDELAVASSMIGRLSKEETKILIEMLNNQTNMDV